nr:hypothetical protein [Candidatus Njordarchaeum guaymaensis]
LIHLFNKTTCVPIWVYNSGSGPHHTVALSRNAKQVAFGGNKLYFLETSVKVFADIQNENPGTYIINDTLAYIRWLNGSTATGSVDSSIFNYDLLVVSVVNDSASHYYTSTEKQLIDQFLRNGKVVLIITSDDLHAARVQICNELLTYLGAGAAFNGYYTNWSFHVVNPMHPLANNVSSFPLSGGYPIVSGTGTTTIARDSLSNTVLAESRIRNGSVILTTWQVFSMTASSSDARQFVKNLLSYSSSLAQAAQLPVAVGGLFADIQNENPPNYLINDALSFVRTIGWNTTTGSISSGIASYNLLVISAVYDNANHYYTSTEKQMVDQFLRSGKIVLIITSDDLHAARVQICNELLTSLGTGETFNGYYTNWPFQVVNSSHPLAHNISRFSLTGGHPVITGSGAATIVRDSSSNTVLAECRIGNGKIILTTWQIFCMTASSSDVRQFVKNLLSYTGYVPQPQVSPPTVLIPSSGNNATTPAGFFEENGFSVITHNAANVSIAIWASSPPETTATLSGKSTYIFLEIEGTFIPGTSVITVYIFYNRTKVQGLGIDEHSMKLYTWNSTTSTWEELTQPDGSPASNVVVLNNTHGCIVGYLYHLSYFAVFGTALPVGIGTSTTVLIMAVAGIVVALCMVLVIRMRKGASLPKEESDEWKAGRSGAAESAKMAEQRFLAKGFLICPYRGTKNDADIKFCKDYRAGIQT